MSRIFHELLATDRVLCVFSVTLANETLALRHGVEALRREYAAFF